ncbi:MAG: VWA domain-containing protein [Planctomycetota bacterium]
MPSTRTTYCSPGRSPGRPPGRLGRTLAARVLAAWALTGWVLTGWALTALAAALPASPQGRGDRGPRTAEAALAAFAEVRARSEGERIRAARALGDFDDDAVTAVLLEELAAATQIAYRQQLLRALGARPRRGAVPGLLAAFDQGDNARVIESAAEALVAQPDGPAALLAVLDRPAPKGPGADRSRRTAALRALGTLDDPAARERLVREARAAAGRDRLPALRALEAVADAADVDALRVELATDRDPVVAAVAVAQLARHGHPQAAEAALQLHRRGKDLDAEQHAAILHGLLLAPTAATFGAIVDTLTRADDPFAGPRAPLWATLLADPAFAAFALDAANGAKDPAAARTLAQLVGRLPAANEGDAVRALARLLRSDAAPVAQAAAQALLLRGGDDAGNALASAVQQGGEPGAPIALSALAMLRGDDAAFADQLVRLAADGKPELRAAALQLLAERTPPPAEALAPALDGLRHAAWPVRAAAVRLCLRLREPAAIPALIARHDDPQRRVAADVRAALHALTGRWFADAKAWRAWWDQEGPAFELPAATPPARRDDGAATATYWNIPITSDRVLFVVDTSGSMLQPFGGGRDGGTRLDEAQRQLERAIGELPPKARCNVIAFGGGADAFLDRLQPADGRRRKVLLERTRSLEARGPTNVAGALMLALADPDVDTVFLLTDGRPSAGPIVDPDELARAVREWNRGRAIAIHTIALGGRSELLERLAQDSGGQHTVAR